MKLPEPRKILAASYRRVSTLKQAHQGVSLDDQDQRIDSYADLFGIEITTKLTDTSSAKNIKSRPAMQSLIALAQSGAINTVITTKLDRMFRNTVEAIVTINQLTTLGVDVIILNFGGQPLDTSSPQGKAFIGLMAVFGEFERNITSERTTDALRHKRDNGLQYCAKPPYGFMNKRGKMIQNPEEIEVLRFVYDSKKEGDKMSIIAKNLQKMHLRNRKGHFCWDASNLAKSLTKQAVISLFQTWDEEGAMQ